MDYASLIHPTHLYLEAHMHIPFLSARGSRAAAAALRASEAKASRVGPLIAFQGHGRAVWTPRDYAALAREGFARNAIVYRCVRMVAEATASVPWLLYEGAAEVDQHALLTLLAKPNRRQAGADFREALAGYLLVSGNAYIQVATVDGLPRELYTLRPDRMKVVPGSDGWPEAYEYTVGGRTVRFTDPGEGMLSPILQLALFHPLDDHYGFAPIEAAAVALDLHNAAGAWNKALLDNSARPSGALVYSAKDGGNLSAEQYERLKSELETGFTGATRAGRPLLLEGGLDWKAMGLTPKDMDFLEAKNGAARLRRAADAARHSRRQHVCELPGGQPRVLAGHRAAAGGEDRRRLGPMADAGVRAGSAALVRHRPGGRARRRPRGALGAGGRGGFSHRQREARRGGVWGGGGGDGDK